MEYRLCVSTRKSDLCIEYAYAFYNQHDFCVYKKKGVSDLCERVSYVNIILTALTYFRTHMRNRYYDEHFSELLYEDEAKVLCSDRELCDVFDAYRRGEVDIDLGIYSSLLEMFDVKSVSFVYSCEANIQKETDKLLSDFQ